MRPRPAASPAIERDASRFVIDAAILAEAFGLTPGEVPGLMRDGGMTSLCEKGAGKDAGRWRLSFFHGDMACRFTVDDAGTILKRARFPRLAGPGGR